MKGKNNFQIGQVVTYKVCASVYSGTIVKIKERSLIVIDSNAGMILWNMGYAVGDEITFNQVV
jgi:hypothetical protein